MNHNFLFCLFSKAENVGALIRALRGHGQHQPLKEDTISQESAHENGTPTTTVVITHLPTLACVQLVYNKNLLSSCDSSDFSLSPDAGHQCCDRRICLGMLYIWHNSADVIHFSLRNKINTSKGAEVCIIDAYLEDMY